MNVEAAPATDGAAAPMIVPSEPVSIVVDEKLAVVLNKDGGVESMEVNGGMALQVLSSHSALHLHLPANTHSRLPSAVTCFQPAVTCLQPAVPGWMHIAVGRCRSLQAQCKLEADSAVTCIQYAITNL